MCCRFSNDPPGLPPSPTPLYCASLAAFVAKFFFRFAFFIDICAFFARRRPWFMFRTRSERKQAPFFPANVPSSSFFPFSPSPFRPPPTPPSSEGRFNGQLAPIECSSPRPLCKANRVFSRSSKDFSIFRGRFFLFTRHHRREFGEFLFLRPAPPNGISLLVTALPWHRIFVPAWVTQGNSSASEKRNFRFPRGCPFFSCPPRRQKDCSSCGSLVFSPPSCNPHSVVCELMDTVPNTALRHEANCPFFFSHRL